MQASHSESLIGSDFALQRTLAVSGDAFDYLGVEESQAVLAADAWGQGPC